MLLENGAEVDPKDRDGRTPLSLLSGPWYTENAKLLLGNGADVNLKSESGRTALLYMAEYNDFYGAVAKVLLDNGADVDSQCFLGRTPLWYATRKSNSDLVKVLLENGANPKLEDDEGCSPESMGRANKHLKHLFK